VDQRFEVDLAGLQRSLRTVDHVLMRFQPVPQRLLIDYRSSEEGGPGICVLPQAHTLAERLASVESARPGLPRLERLYVVTWPLRVASLERLGLLDIVRERLASLDAFGAIAELNEAHEELLALEREELRRAITGEGYRTLWPRASQPSS
jgi:hypothetical protein